MRGRLLFGFLGVLALVAYQYFVGSRSALRARRLDAAAPTPRWSEPALRWPKPLSLPVETADAVRPATEETYLRTLRELARTDRERALAYVERGEVWFGDRGLYAETRRALRVTLLVDLERMSEARASTREFLERYPASEYRRLVEGVTGLHTRPGPPAHLAGR